MEVAAQVEELTSGARGRLIHVFKNLRRSIVSYDSFRKYLLMICSFFIWILLLLPRRHRLSTDVASPPSSPRAATVRRKKFVLRRNEEDMIRRRALAEAIEMAVVDNSLCQCTTSLFFGVRRNALFCR